MRRSCSSSLFTCVLSTFNLSTLILVILIFPIFLSHSALAQGTRKKMLPSEENERDQQQKRAEWNMRGREAPKGQSAAALRFQAHQQKMAMRAQRMAAARTAMAQSPSAPQVTNWVGLGPAPLASDASVGGFQNYNWVSGRATSVLIDPADATGNTVLLGGAYGGLWRSTNAGSKSANPDSVVWQSLIDDQPSLAVGAIALQPGNSNVILAGTGETNSSGDSYFGMGMLRSTDGGTTWTAITSAASGQSFVGVGFSKIAFSTSNTNLVVASTAGDIGFDYGLEQDAVSTARGLYYSTDAGATWNRVTLSDSSVAASVTGVVYNAKQGANGTFYAAIRRHGIYSSTDGVTFTRLANQPTTGLVSANCPANSNSTNCDLYRAEFAVTPGRNEMYVWVVDDQSVGEVDDGIWKTTNGGTAWVQIPDNGITNCGQGGDSGGETDGCGVQQGLYNLEVAALPNGTGTDVYAGTINLYKCNLASGASSCSTIDPNVPTDWINLTHVYGCSNTELGALAHVHPDQHGLGFLVSNGKAEGYFAHDGGISRTLDGYTGLNSGSCTGTNQFDSLSQTLGSMTEFVSFSVHPSSADILLGGTQDNGSPKTSTATSSTSWQNALSGDGGYNAINPNPGPPAGGGDGIAGDEWFISNPESVIGVCEDGTICNDNDAYLEALPGYPNPNVGNIDQGAFYTPYILDPQNTDEMLIGTCRVWRGPTASSVPGQLSVFSQLSVNFDTLDTTLCNGSEVNQVAGVAAGGPTDTNGFSKVVYATTWGYGPLANIGGGEVWVTTNAAATTPAMTNVTGNINSSNYAIAAVAIDTSVASGQTAYVGIMGFHTPHVWKTTNAGGAWTDWTGTGSTALPDAPVSALLIDSVAGVIYAGTDVGIFSSPTSGTGGVWTEVGPVAGPGAGFLPSAPVTAIRIFNSGGVKVLRVSTYGRGIWEYNLATTPSFTIAAAPSTLSIAQGSNGTSTITVTPSGGFSGSVSLAVTSTLPTGVTASFNPTSTGTTSVLTLTASGSAVTGGPTTVTVTGTSGSLTATTMIALTVTPPPDFTLSAAPSTLSIGQGTNGTSTVTVNPANGFTSSVALAVTSTLPTGVTASFNPTSTGTTSVLTLTASGSATVGGPTTVTITGTFGSLTHTTTIALTVTPPPNFTLSAAPTSLTITPTLAGGTSTVTVNPANGFSGSVALAVTSTLPTGVTASFNPTSTGTTSVLTLTASGSATASGPTTVTVTGTSGSLTHTTTIALTVNPPPSFTLAAAPGTLSIAQGVTAGGTSTITVGPTNGFTGSVALTVTSTLPSGVTASFNPTSTSTTSVLTLTASNTATVGGPTTVTVTGTSGSLTHTATIALTITPIPFTIGSIANVTIATPGSSGVASVGLTGNNGFTGPVTITCTLPAAMTEATCPSVTATTLPATAMVTITTTAPHQVAAIRSAATGMLGFGVLAGFFMFAIPGIRRSKAPLALLVFGLVVLIASCGGGGGSSTRTDPGTPAGTYTVNLSAAGGGATVPATFSVTVQ
jgi:hypothetical protein